MAVTLTPSTAPVTPARPVRDRHHRGVSRWVVLALVTVGALVMLVPFAFMLLNAFKSPGDYSSGGPLSWPTEFYTKGLRTYWTEVNFPLKFWNSAIIAGSVAVLGVAVSLLNAYALGIGRVRGRLWIVGLFLLANMLPQEALIYPLYYVAKQVGLYNTQLSVIIIFTVIQSAFGTYLLASVMGTFPRSLLEAAALDGAGKWTDAVAGGLPQPAAHPGGAAHLLLHLDLERVPHPAGHADRQPDADHSGRARVVAGRPADGRSDHQRRRADQPGAGHPLLPHLPAHSGARHHGRSREVKFTDGYWQLRPGVSVLRPGTVESVEPDERGFTVFAPTGQITGRGDTLNRPLVTVRFFSPAPGVIGVTIAHHTGGLPREPHFGLSTDETHPVTVDVTGLSATLTTGELTARVALIDGWQVDFLHGDRLVTASTARSIGVVTDAEGRRHVHERLALGVGETVYGLGERFGPFVKNGQTVDIWNADGGTASEQAYKNVPFYLSSAGYGVFVDHPEHVSFEVGSEVVTQTQFSVEGQSLDLLRHRRAPPEGRAAPVHRAHRPPGPHPRVVVRALAVHLVHHLVRREDRDRVHRRDGRARTAAVGVPLRLLLDASVPLVRLRLGPGDLPRPGGDAAPAARART